MAPLFEQAKVCANHLAMKGFGRYDGSVVSTKLKVTGIDLFSAGDFAPGADNEEIVMQDASRGVYKRIILRDKKIIGAVLYGDTVDGPWYFQLLRDGTDVSRHPRPADVRRRQSRRWRPSAARTRPPR